MKFSEAWLREWVDPDIDSVELRALLTMSGLEVGGHGPVARDCSGIVVGKVESVNPHPDADKLSLCEVSDGKGSFQVVCGAANLKSGMKAPFAKIGSEIHPDERDEPFVIKAAKLRGVESQGMLCSAEELGLEESSTGLLELPSDAKTGLDIRDYLGLDDLSIELDLTPNRGDCLGMLGLSREVGALTKTDVCTPKEVIVAPAVSDKFQVRITATDECPRYLGRIIRNIDLDAKSPLWMREKLRRSGLRSIDPVVDVTNYVLMELGQPMHAFDFSRLEGHIAVRLAKKGEKLTLLDGREVSLNPDALVIADAKKAVAMAGIMGGLDTAVSGTTRDIFLECAYFSPLAVSGKARSLGMQTDASHRYERGVDFNLQRRAMERATGLLLDIVGGEPGPVTEALGTLPEPVEIDLKLNSISSLLGVKLELEEVEEILSRLGFGLLRGGAGTLKVRVPSFRFDIAIEADLIEELARVYGYNQIPSTSGAWRQVLKPRPEARVSLRSLKSRLVALGYQEVVNYSFIDRGLAEKFSAAGAELVQLQNPISRDMAVMRPSILPGLVASLAYNANRQQGRARLFESGLVFAGNAGDYGQKVMLGGLITGWRFPENWSNDKELTDFYDVKGDIETLLSVGGRENDFRYVAAQVAGLHLGQCARIEGPGGPLGCLGALHPAIQRELGLVDPVYLFEIELDSLQSGHIPRFRELSRYPRVSRDLALVVDETVPGDAVLAVVREHAGDALRDLRIFDVYQGDGVTKGKKSLALGLTWQHPSRTLSDDEINSIIGSCINALQEQFNANLRN